MKRIISLFFCFLFFISCSSTNSVDEKPMLIGMPNPWTDCNTNLKQASEIAGFTFPLTLSNYTARAMNGMIEINYPLDEFRTVCLRKVDFKKYDVNDDISGVYMNYPINKEIKLNDDTVAKVRGDENKIYVANIITQNGHYCAYCKEGMTTKEIEDIYNIIIESEKSEN